MDELGAACPVARIGPGRREHIGSREANLQRGAGIRMGFRKSVAVPLDVLLLGKDPGPAFQGNRSHGMGGRLFMSAGSISPSIPG
jgi:hypothetical protein